MHHWEEPAQVAALHLLAGLQVIGIICGQPVSRFPYMRGTGALASLPHLLPRLVLLPNKASLMKGLIILHSLYYSINQTAEQVVQVV